MAIAGSLTSVPGLVASPPGTTLIPFAMDSNTLRPIDRVVTPVPATAREAVKQLAMEIALDVRHEVKTCADLASIPDTRPRILYFRTGLVRPADLSQAVNHLFARSNPG
jgi:hypothetical protein